MKIQMVRDLSLFKKVACISLVTNAILIGIVGFFIIPLIQSHMFKERKTALQNVVEASFSLVKDYAQRAAAGEFTVEAAKERARQRLQAMRYADNDQEYLFILSADDTHTIMHPVNPELNGQDMSPIVDIHGKRFFQEMTDVAKRDSQGFIDYYWPKPGSDEPLPKLTFVRLYAPWGWVIGSGIYTDDVEAAIRDVKYEIYAAILVIVALSLGLTLIIARMIVIPLKRSVEFAEQVAQGDLTRQIDIPQKDEVGVLAGALNRMGANLARMVAELLEKADTIGAAATELSAVSQQISAGSKQTAGSCSEVTRAASEMTTSMTTVASATEEASGSLEVIVQAAQEMSSTIGEIAANTAKGRQTTAQAVETAKEVSTKVENLDKAAMEINQITETIADISGQTNLLALNATIEAARAGDAGKGFAVVAAEIKDLAKQTAEATGEINAKISGIQTTTRASVAAIESIVGVINEIDQIVSTVAAAIEEQSASTGEISSNVSHAAQGLGEVNQNVAQAAEFAQKVTQDMSEVSLASNEVSVGSAQVNASASELSKLAETLNEMVARFKI